MMKPTDEELEAMAERLDRGERRMDRKPADNNAAEAALRREAAALLRACKGRVKPLEWKPANGSGRVMEAQGFNIKYRIWKSNGAVYWQAGYMAEWRETDTPETGKAAAQADYEARILAALEQEHRHE